MAYLHFCPGIHLERLRNFTKHLQDSWCPDQDSNQAPTELSLELYHNTIWLKEIILNWIISRKVLMVWNELNYLRKRVQ
jgi:hypothetical protein